MIHDEGLFTDRGLELPVHMALIRSSIIAD